MADLKSLIRLRRHRVEEKQKILADIFRQVEQIENRKKELLHRLEAERKALDENPLLETSIFFGRFQAVIRRDVERLDGELVKLESRLLAAQEEVRLAFTEMKRIEIVDDRRAVEERKKIEDKESAELDAIGIEGFRRKEEF